MVQVPYSDKQMAPARNTSSCLMLIICKHQMHFSSECRKSDSLRILNRKWVSPSANTNLKRIPYCTSNICSIKHMDVLGDLPAGPHKPSGVPPMCSETLKQPLVTPTWSPQTRATGWVHACGGRGGNSGSPLSLRPLALALGIMEGLLNPPRTWVRSQTPPHPPPTQKKKKNPTSVRKVMPSLRRRSDKRIAGTNPLQRFLFLIFLKNEGTVGFEFLKIYFTEVGAVIFVPNRASLHFKRSSNWLSWNFHSGLGREHESYKRSFNPSSYLHTNLAQNCLACY